MLGDSGIYKAPVCSGRYMGRRYLNVFFMIVIMLSPLIKLAVGTVPHAVLVCALFVWVGLLLGRNYFCGYGFFVAFFLLILMFFLYLLKGAPSLAGIYLSSAAFVLMLSAYWLTRQDVMLVSSAAFCSLMIFYTFFFCSLWWYGSKPEDIDKFFIGESRNYVSAMAFFLQLIYSASKYRANLKLPVVTPFITGLIAFLCFGRAGVALALAFVMVSLVVYSWQSRGGMKAFLILQLLIAVAFAVYNHGVILEYLVNSTKFREGLNTPRIAMVEEYFSGMDFVGFMLGRDISNLPTVVEYGGNPHNSFIYGHYLYGFVYVVLLAWLFSVFFYYCCLRRGYALYGLFVVFFLVRILTDQMSLPGVFDLFFYYIYFVVVFDGGNRLLKNGGWRKRA